MKKIVRQMLFNDFDGAHPCAKMKRKNLFIKYVLVGRHGPIHPRECLHRSPSKIFLRIKGELKNTGD